MTALDRFIFVDVRDGNIVNTEEKRLTLAYEGLTEIPRILIDGYGSIIEILDLSYNQLRCVEFLSRFDNLTTIIMDNNLLGSDTVFPVLPTVTTIWLNKNLIDKLHPFVENLKKSFPNLEILSLMGNPGAPSYLNGGTYYEYLNYRLFIISLLPNLKYLDDKRITNDERREAGRLFGHPFYSKFLRLDMPEYVNHIHGKLKSKLSNISWNPTTSSPIPMNLISWSSQSQQPQSLPVQSSSINQVI